MLIKNYYPGLNDLRALAALSVIPGHLEEFKRLFGFSFNDWYPVPGKVAVVLFFVISGFLITALLLKEKTNSGKISLKKFYAKRALRIWPLYFLLLGLSIFFLNRVDFFKIEPFSSGVYNYLDNNTIILLLLVMPNYIKVIIPYATQIWSIGFEEQFYLFQPFVLKLARNLWMMTSIMIVIVFFPEILNDTFLNQYHLANIIGEWSVYFSCIAIGSIGAILCFAYPEFVKKYIHSKTVQIVTLLLFITFIVTIQRTQDEYIIDFRFFSILFTIIVINAATNPASFYNLKNRVLVYIGRISYGIYMYHIICIVLALKAVEYLSKYIGNNTIITDISIYSLTILFAIGISSFSFKYFEGWFLGLKRKL